MTTFLQVLLNGPYARGGLFAIVSIGPDADLRHRQGRELRPWRVPDARDSATWMITTSLGLHPYAAVIVVVPALFILGADPAAADTAADGGRR